MVAPTLLNESVIFTETQTRLPAQLELKKWLAPTSKMHHRDDYSCPDISLRVLLTRRILSFVKTHKQYLAR